MGRMAQPDLCGSVTAGGEMQIGKGSETDEKCSQATETLSRYPEFRYADWTHMLAS